MRVLRRSGRAGRPLVLERRLPQEPGRFLVEVHHGVHDVAVAVDHDLDDESPAQQAAEHVTPADSDPVRDERVVDAVSDRKSGRLFKLRGGHAMLDTSQPSPDSVVA